MKRVILHLGLHKTASTSIQVSLQRGAENLLEAGCCYPTFTLGEHQISNHSIPVYSMYCAQPQSYHMNVRWGVDAAEANRAYRDQFVKILSAGHETVLLSGEDISLLTRDQLLSLQADIRKFDYAITALACIRAPTSALISHIQGSVKNGASLGESIKPPQTERIVRKLDRSIEGVRYYSFQEACSHPDGPLGCLFEKAGIDRPQGIPTIQRNSSLSDLSVRVISHVNAEEPLFIDGALNPLRKSGDTQPLQRLTGPRFSLREQELDRYREELQRQNAFLVERFDASFADAPERQTAQSSPPPSLNKTAIDQLDAVLPKLDGRVRELVHEYIDGGQRHTGAIRRLLRSLGW